MPGRGVIRRMASLTTGVTTLADAQARLQMLLDAEQAIARGAASYSIGDRSLTRADLSDIYTGIQYWQRAVQEFSQAAAGATVGHKVATWSG